MDHDQHLTSRQWFNNLRSGHSPRPQSRGSPRQASAFSPSRPTYGPRNPSPRLSRSPGPGPTSARPPHPLPHATTQAVPTTLATTIRALIAPTTSLIPTGPPSVSTHRGMLLPRPPPGVATLSVGARRETVEEAARGDPTSVNSVTT